MRYTLFFTSSHFRLPTSDFPAPKSLLRSPCSLKTRNLYLTSRRIAILFNMMSVRDCPGEQVKVAEQMNYVSSHQA
ncbi:MAG: hypothetical protein F6K65_35140 [Moorea sp. SIO3C2]|nr:hypothetical protein [Moorena sp. SIO3C2]